MIVSSNDNNATSQWQKTFYDMSGNAYKTVYYGHAGLTWGVKKNSKTPKIFIYLFSAFGCIKLKTIDGYTPKNDKIVTFEIIDLTPQV